MTIRVKGVRDDESGLIIPEDLARAREQLADLQDAIANGDDTAAALGIVSAPAAVTEDDDAKAWPAGRAEPHGGWDPYLYGIHLIAELGLMRVHSKNVLLRAVMPGRKGSVIQLAGAHVREAVCFEVVALAPDIDPEELHHPTMRPHGLKPGDEVLHLSASSDPVDPRNPECPFFFVALEDLAGSWDVRVLQAILAGGAGMTIDELREHARAWLDDNAVARKRPGIFARLWAAVFGGGGVEHVRADGSIRHARIQSRKQLPRDATTHYVSGFKSLDV